MSYRIAFLVACLGLAGCLGSRDGGGSETTVAGLSGKVVDASGKAVAGAVIRVRPEDALPPAMLGAAAGGEEEAMGLSKADGSFLIENLAPGSYVVEVRDSGTAGAALLTAQVAAADSLVRLPDAVVRPTGAVRGQVRHPPESFGMTMTGVYVYIPGLIERVLARVQDSLMPFTLGNIPSGRYTLRVQAPFAMELSRLRVLEVPNVEIRPGDTLDLGQLDLPVRAGLDDPAYLQDSAAAQAILDTNGTPEWLSTHTTVTGNRITGFHDFNGRIRRIPKEIASLDRLEVLQLHGGEPPIGLEAAPEFSRVRGLKRILLWGYAMDTLPDWPLGFPELAGLRLQEMGMTVFPARAAALPFLTSLDLGDNRIPSIPAAIAKMKRLRVLDMSGNELTALPVELQSLEGLRGFRARGNRLCGLDSQWKAWLTRQDSLWKSQADPLSYWNPGPDSGWEATQRCGSP